jgi:hypothetical protein
LQQALSNIQSSGVAGLQLNTVSSFLTLENDASIGTRPLKLAEYRKGSAHLLRVKAVCPYEVLAISWTLAALFAPPPLDLACALIALWYQIVGLFFC